jgi:hypothetical protein
MKPTPPPATSQPQTIKDNRSAVSLLRRKNASFSVQEASTLGELPKSNP